MQLLSMHRIIAIFYKEFIQMKRDRITFAMILVIPIMQLLLFGFAINTSPKHLPTAVIIQDDTPLTRRIVSAMQLSEYFTIVENITTDQSESYDSTYLFQSGQVNFILTIPSGFTKAWVRGERPNLLLEADATDPSAAAMAVAQIPQIVKRAVLDEPSGHLHSLRSSPESVGVIVHNKYNPEGITQYNIVPGLLGVIITMTMVMITSIAMTREAERGTLENLLAMPAKPFEIMIGKIVPYIFMGCLQSLIVIIASRFIFHIPFAGSLLLLISGIGLFLIINLAIGFTFSTIAKSQIQAMQLTFFFFLPSILLSGFMFPFRGMPLWVQYIGEILPLTHFLRIVRGIMLKDATFLALKMEFLALLITMCVVVIVAMLRYRQTLD